MKVIHLNASDSIGGAARAAYRLHRSMLSYGAELDLYSTMRVTHKLTHDHTVICKALPPATRRQRIYRNFIQSKHQSFRTGNPILHSTAWPDTGLGQELEYSHRSGEANLVNLHWLGDSTVSIEEIGYLSCPLIWTLHDQWAFCGAEHYTTPPQHGESASTDERFVIGYAPSSRPSHESGYDLNRHTWIRKSKSWQRPIHIVSTSKWMLDCARRSALMSSWKHSIIPNPIDLTTWAPFDQKHARGLFNLPTNRPLVLFGAPGGTSDPRKGADLLFEALQHLRMRLVGSPLANLELVVFGQSRPAHPPDLGFPIHYVGNLNDDVSLRLLYTTADVFVIPSRQDTLLNTGLEAHACGIPVVAFRTGGLPDIVEHRITGALADPFDPVSMAESLIWVLEDPQRREQLGRAARARALSSWSPQRIVSMYADVYQEALDSSL